MNETLVSELKQMVAKTCEAKTIFAVSYSNLEAIVNKAYGLSYKSYNERWSFIADQEMGNDSDKEITIKEGQLDDYDQNQIDDFRNGNGGGSFMAHTIMTDLCNQGILAPGSYIISVCW